MTPSVPDDCKSFWTKQYIPYCDPAVLDSVAEFHAGTTIALPPVLPVSFAAHVPPETLRELAGSESRYYPEDAQSRRIPPTQMRGDLVRSRSVLRFAEAPLSSDAIYSILDASFLASPEIDPLQGIQHRPYPSAGGLFPVEAFVALLKPLSDHGELDEGIYHILPVSRRLVRLQTAATHQWIDVVADTVNYGHPPLALIYVVNGPKAVFKYGVRGYRHALLEAGSMYHQVDLCARAIHLGTRLWSGFQDYRLCQLLSLSPEQLFPVIVQWVGREEPA